MPDHIPQRLTREMGLNLAEFSRSFVAAVEPHTYTVKNRAFTVAHPEGEIVITLGVTTARKIAMLAIPMTPVDFDFGVLSEVSRQRFMTQFDRYFHRGGG